MVVSVERVVRNRVGLLEKTPIPDEGENLFVERQNFVNLATVKVLGSVVELAYLVDIGGLLVEGPSTLVPIEKKIIDLGEGKERRIQGKNKSGAVIVYRFVPDKMNPLQKIARALHR